MKGYVDIAELPEDDRIALIARTAAAGNVVGVALEDDDAKIARYESKLRADGARIIDRKPGLVAGTILLRVGPKES